MDYSINEDVGEREEVDQDSSSELEYLISKEDGETEDQGIFESEYLISEEDGEMEVDQGFSSESEEGMIDLETLSNHPHPCMAPGYFSIFNSPDVAPLRLARELEYSIDMDGVVILSKHLSTFRVCDFGEARAYSKCPAANLHDRLSKSQLFEMLPDNLSRYERWLPGFKLFDGPMNPVYVVFRVKSDANARDVHQLQEEKGLGRKWWTSILLPAVHSLSKDTRTRRYNTPSTFQTTRVLPKFVRIYSEDLALLHEALQEATMECSFHLQLAWYFVSSKYGQRVELVDGEILGPEAFNLSAMFDLSRTVIVSIHLAINFICKDKTVSLFWHRTRTADWSTSRARLGTIYPLFGLTELANVHVHNPRSSVIGAATGSRITFLQHYTPMVKSMNNWNEAISDRLLIGRPHLLTYLLGAGYVCKRPKFKHIWEEVHTQQTLHQIIEAVHPSVPFEARMEVVITDVNLSFLSSFRHNYLARAVVRDGLLIKVPTHQFSGYVQNLVTELYQPMQAAIQGTLAGPGALGTVILCESLINFLVTGTSQHQSYQVLKAYDVVPISALAKTRRIDLRSIAKIRDGFLYVTRPALEKIWVPMGSLTASARATASAMLSFLESLKAGRNSLMATTRAADIIVNQFKHDLIEMGMVKSAKHFQTAEKDDCIKDVMTADEYVSHVFVPQNLPSEMSTKAFLTMAMDLLHQPTLRKKVAQKLLKEVKIVPRTTVHSRVITFSPSVCTLLTERQLSGRLMSATDVQRLVQATTPMLRDAFNLKNPAIRAIQRRRPRLTRVIRNALERVRRNKRGRVSKILAVMCLAMVVLANKEKLFPAKLSYKRLYRTTNLSRYIRVKEMNKVVERTWNGDFDTRECRIVLDKIVIPQGQGLSVKLRRH